MNVLLLTVFVDLVGFGIIFPILPFFAQVYGATPLEITLLIATYSALQIVSAPLWGRLSDRFGRKWVLLATLAGGGIAYLWFGLADDLVSLFVARAISGAAAGNIAVAQAFAADLTGGADRAKAMGRLGAAFGFGFVVGPSLGGLLYDPGAGAAGFFLPCMVAAAISAGAVVLGAIVLREPPARDTHPQRTGSFAEALGIMKGNGLPLFVALNLIVTLSFTAMVSVFPIWCQAQLNWGPREVGYAFAWIGVLVAIMQGLAIGPLTRLIGEPRVLLLGATSLSLGMLMAPWVSNAALFAVNAVFMCAGTSFCHPTLTALISQRAGARHQGSILGLSNAVASSGRVASPPVAGLIFQTFGANWPLIVAGFLIWPVILSAGILSLRARAPKEAANP
jgi:DHA1 family tetracycline resistance protein-like MFS transporter